jgi:Tol biopolymer transport system component
MSADGSGLRRLSAPDLQAYRPRWSPDGAHIAFFSPLGDVYTVRPDGSELLRLTTDGSSMWPFWTRDGRIVFVRRASPNLGRGELWVVGADGRGATQLDVSVAALTAVGCIVCPYPDPSGTFPADGRLDLAFWQPNPGGSR